METLESSRMCRLCGQHSGIFINIFDENENHAKKINAVLPILVHEMDLLPKQMCHRCSYKLEEFHKFYSDCLKTDSNLKSQLSWMRKREVREHVRVPMVQIENVKIKTEPPDYDIYELDPIVENVNYINSMSSMIYSMNNARNNNEVDSHRSDEIDKRLMSNSRPHECSHCKYSVDKANSNSDTTLSINCTNIKSIHEVRRDSSSTDLGTSSRLNNAFRHSSENCRLNDMHKAKKRRSEGANGVNIGNILNINEVKEIKIKTEKPDDIVTRSLRPRKKSVDYLGSRRKKSNLIANPASISKTGYVKRKSLAKQTPSTVVSGIPIDKIKKEPVEEVQSRILRPRKFSINYLGSKRKERSSMIGSQDRSTSQEALVKRRKSSFGNSKRFIGLGSERDQFKVKQEIISDDETQNVEKYDVMRCNEISENSAGNLGNLFDRKTHFAIKAEKNVEDEISNRDWKSAAASSRANKNSKSLTKLTPSKIKSKKVVGKRISDINYSPKYLRSQDLRLRNGKVKKPESNFQLSLGNLKKRFLASGTWRSTIGRKLPAKIKENVNVMKVPTLFKNSTNIKHFCEKCCTSFINKELYMLHACYYD